MSMDEEDRVRIQEMLEFVRALLIGEAEVLSRPLLNRIVEAEMHIPPGLDEAQLMEIFEINSRNMRTFLSRPTPQTASYKT